MMAQASPNGSVLYVSGEESVGQVKMRSDRLGIKHPTCPNLYLASETNIESIIAMIQHWDADAPCAGVMIDSIQTMYSSDINSTAGSIDANIPMLLIGHITKSGDIAGPKVLEHIVDTVIQLDGDAHNPNRFLRCTKNRFGTTSEVGVLSMTDAGLVPLQNPLQAFLSPTVTIAVEGTRPIPVEIQTLSSPSFEEHRTSCKCHGVSSATKRPVLPNAVFFGEVALSGMLRPAVMLEARLAAASKIGVDTCIIPRVTSTEGKKAVDKYRLAMHIQQVDTLVDALALGLLQLP
ncbi:hypothetical protein DYB35_002453 [Aphanomyces astaci]|uniref:Lon proteolytic domain-containing protein n=1 Tax=Aphanomyces astaci TaxID=112090 RepID=A0A3R6ZD20_APHAT|nr:hypothetical protein DYB35_002453 [Aphanomyces astaci]